MNISLEELTRFAVDVAKAGGAETLTYFRKKFDVIRKEDDSPVTVADRQAEQTMRGLINQKFPEHGIIGEEYGTEKKDASVKWILDPIDGTIGFVHGIPLYTTLIGITIDDEPVIGVIYAPFMDEMVYAWKGGGCFFNGERTSVRPLDKLESASMMTSDVKYFDEFGYKNSFHALMNRVKTYRTYGDAYGHLMVATGRADIMLDPVLNIWDAAALLPVITEAGGSFTDLQGNARIDGGNGFSCHPDWKETILNIIKEND